LYLTQFLPVKLTFYGRISKSVACVALVGAAADEIRITNCFFRSFRVKKVNELVVSNNKLTNNFMVLVTTGLGLDVACRPPVGPHWIKV
jgi:hypothetical protein